MWASASSAGLRVRLASAFRAFVTRSQTASAEHSGRATPTETPEKPATPLPLIERRAQRVCNRSRSQAQKYVQTNSNLCRGSRP